MEITEALFINFSVKIFFVLQKYLLGPMNHYHIWLVSHVKYESDILQASSVFTVMRNWENDIT